MSFAYYDRVLVAILASLVGGVLGSVVVGVPRRAGLLGGSLVATVFVYDALFRRPPRPAPSARAKTAAVLWHVFLGSLLVTVVP